MSDDTATFKVGDRVNGDGDPGVILAVHGGYAWVAFDRDVEPTTDNLHNLTLIPPAPVAVSWRNVYGHGPDIIHRSRMAADAGRASNRLGVIVGYGDGTYKLEVVDQ